MSAVKRYWLESYVDDFYKAREFVLVSDYDILTVECQRLREDRDSYQRTCMAEIEKVARLREALEEVAECPSNDATEMRRIAKYSLENSNV